MPESRRIVFKVAFDLLHECLGLPPDTRICRVIESNPSVNDGEAFWVIAENPAFPRTAEGNVFPRADLQHDEWRSHVPSPIPRRIVMGDDR